jgi:hypothetical protein
MARQSAENESPKVGIWWDNGKAIADFSHPHNENASCIADRIDSNLAHVDLWAKAAKKMKVDPSQEYFSIPRGRVLLDRVTLNGIIFHGPATTAERLEMIAKLFCLSAWRSEQDLHYFIGSDADRLFQDEDD